MGITAISGPEIVYGDNVFELKNDISPSMFANGQGFVDDRAPFEYVGTSNESPKVYGFPQQQLVQTLNATIYTPTLIVNIPIDDFGPNIPLPYVPFSAPGMTLGLTVRESETGKIIKNVVGLDDYNLVNYNGDMIATTATSFDENGNAVSWDPSKLSTRRLFFSTAVDPNTFDILGLDEYGFYVSETVLAPVQMLITTRKSYKFIISIIPSQLDGSASGFSILTQSEVGFPLRYDYPGTYFPYVSGVLDANPADVQSSLYTITGITPLAGILTITIADSVAFVGGQPYQLPIGSDIIIDRCNPASYNGTYTVLTAGPSTLTVASTNVDAYVSGGTIFCDQSGPFTADVRGIYLAPFSGDPYNLQIYQSVTLQNMQTTVGQFGIPQFYEIGV